MEAALVGFLGAAIGAALGAWATLYADRKQREEARRHRYSPENRALFMDFLGMAEARALAVRKQARAAWEWSQGRVSEGGVPTLDTTDGLESKLHEIEDAMPSGSLSPLTARTHFFDVLRLDSRSHRPSLPPFDPAIDAEWRQLWGFYEESREIVRRTYQPEVGAAPGPRRSMRERIRRLEK
jgi:hypothetical protein